MPTPVTVTGDDKDVDPIEELKAGENSSMLQ